MLAFVIIDTYLFLSFAVSSTFSVLSLANLSLHMPHCTYYHSFVVSPYNPSDIYRQIYQISEMRLLASHPTINQGRFLFSPLFRYVQLSFGDASITIDLRIRMPNMISYQLKRDLCFLADWVILSFYVTCHM
jgi:hypothetical protein